MSSNSSTEITAYYDAHWVACPITRRSVIGLIIKLGESMVSLKAKKQITISRSSVETEYRSLACTIAELVWLVGLSEYLDVEITLPVNIYSDSKSVIQLEANSIYHERTKHIEIDCHFIREKLQQGLINISYVPTQSQPADVLTKGLNRVQHEFLLSKVGVLNIFAPPSIKGIIDRPQGKDSNNTLQDYS